MRSERIISLCLLAAAVFAVTLAFAFIADDSSAAEEIDGVVYHIDDGTNSATVVGITEKAPSDLVIPDQILNRYTVSGIGDGNVLADWNKVHPTSLIMGDNVKVIGDSAFKGCSTLKTVKFSKGLHTIGVSSFEGCSSLKNIDLYDDVEGIKNAAFKNCSSAVYLHLPSSIVKIDDYAFMGMSALKTVVVEKNVNWNESNIGNIFPDKIFLDIKGNSVQCNASEFSGNTYTVFNSDPDNYTMSACELISIGSQDPSDVIAAFNPMTYTLTVYGHGKMKSYDKSNPSPFIDPKYSNTVSDLTIVEGVLSVGDYDFPLMNNLSHVEFPSSVERIGYASFCCCVKMDKIDLSQTSAIIEPFAFSMTDRPFINDNETATRYDNCVCEIDLGKAYYIGDCAFEYCGLNSLTGVRTLTIPSSVTYIGKEAFIGLDRLEILTVDNNDSWNPSNIHFSAFASVGLNTGEAFFLTHSGCVYKGDPSKLYFTSIKYLIGKDVPSDIVAVFEPKVGVITIDGEGQMMDWTADNRPPWFNDFAVSEYPFSKSIEYVNIRASDVGDYAFCDCEKMINLYLCSTIRSIGNFSFMNCTGIQEIIVEPNSNWNCSSIGFNMLGTTFISDVGDAIMFNDQKFAGHEYKGDFKEMKCTRSFFEIGADDPRDVVAEYDVIECTMTIAASSVSHMKNFEKEQVPWDYLRERIKAVYISKTANIGDNAFAGCINLSKITMDDNLKSIGENSFRGCRSLVDVTIPDSVLYIYEHAFSECSGLKSVTIGENVTELGYCAFSECASLSNLYFRAIFCDDCDEDTKVFKGSCEESGLHVIFEKKVTYVPAYLFYLSPSNYLPIERIDIGSNVSAIGEYAFYGCTCGMVVLPDSIDTIGQYAFSNMKELSSLTIGSNVSIIGKGAFSECPVLEYVSLNSDKFTLNYDDVIFSHSGYLRGLALYAGNIVRIPDYLFYDPLNGEHYDVTSIVLGPYVSHIGICSFRGCIGLTELDISGNVCFVHDEAFRYCTGLTSVHLGNNVHDIGILAFGSCSSLKKVQMDTGSLDIDQSAFEYCTGIEEMDLSCAVVVGDYAFKDCSGMRSFIIGSSISTIGEYAFDFPNLEILNVNSDILWGPSSVFENSFCGKTFYVNSTDTIQCNDPYFAGNIYRKVGDNAMSLSYEYNVGKTSPEEVIGVLNMYESKLTFSAVEYNSKMCDFAEYSETPWHIHTGDFVKIVFGDHVSYIGSYAFSEIPAFDISVPSPSSVSLGTDAFNGSGRIYVGDGLLGTFRSAWPSYYSVFYERIDHPTIASGLRYNGAQQWIVPMSPTYVLAGHYVEVDAAHYTAEVTPASGYCWRDDYVGTLYIEWNIKRAYIESVEIAEGVTFTYKADPIVPEYGQLRITAPGTISSSDVVITASDNISAGTATVTVEASSSSKNFTGVVSCSFTICQKSLSVSCGTGIPTKTYDGSTSWTLVPENYVLSGICGTDDVCLNGAANFNSPYVLKASFVKVTDMELAGAQSSNYVLDVTVFYIDGASIQAKEITAGPAASYEPSKYYDGSIIWYPSGDDHYVLSGLVSGDDVTLEGLYLFDSPNTDATEVNADSLSIKGDSASNYSLTTVDLSYPVAHILPRIITVTPDPGQSKLFGEADPVLKYTYTDAAFGETPVFTGALSRTEGEAAGYYPILIGTLEFKSEGSFDKTNYALDFVPDVMFRIVLSVITKGDFTVDVSDEVYDGTAKTKTITSALKEGIDYAVSYSNNVNAGTAVITISGIGAYSGTLTYDFTILKKVIDIPEPLYYIETGETIEFKDFPVSKYYTETTGNDKFGTDAGTYQYELVLTDPADTVWIEERYSGDYYVYITVESKEYTVNDVVIAEISSDDKGIRADGELSVTGTYDVPESTKALIKDDPGKVLFSYDIKVIAEGKEIQPAGKVTVRVLVPSDVISTDFSIYHIHGDACEKVDYVMMEQYAQFTVDSFSEFVFVKNVNDSMTAEKVIFYAVLGIAAIICAGMVVAHRMRKQ